MTTRAEIVAAARSYMDTRFHHQGRNRAGMDCAGLIVVVARDVGMPVEDVFGYGRAPDGKTLRAELERQMIRVAIEDARDGDVLLMRFDKQPQHLAMLTDKGIIHAYAQVRKVVEHRLDEVWKSRIVGAYTWGGIDG